MSNPQNSSFNTELFATQPSENWHQRIPVIAARFNREYQGQPVELPTEVQAMPIFRDWVGGKLSQVTASPFWEVAQPKKNQHCLDIGCGVSFLIYPWRDWQAFFYGQEISTEAQQILKSRGPQLNSKLFKGVELGSAHRLKYPDSTFDLAIATGFSCYFPPEYWEAVLLEVKRVLKPEGEFVFDVLNPEADLAEDWAVLETYLGAEVGLDPVEDWEKAIKAAGAKVVKKQSGELFDLYKVRFQ
jgi:SAM-dependent methyltransferase